tara:strand:- start:933 stop:1430 length:498 start_codon:yes stop_codon:yes gene_type:complete
MKALSLILALFALLALPSNVFAIDGHEDPTEGERPASTTAHRLNRGESHTNLDEVTLTVDEESTGKASIDPKKGSKTSKTTVRTKTGWIGKVAGIDSNDEVVLGSSSEGSIEGTGGEVSIAGGSTVTVTNTTANPNGTATGQITCTLPSGAVVTIPPGSSATFTT